MEQHDIDTTWNMYAPRGYFLPHIYQSKAEPKYSIEIPNCITPEISLFQ